MAVYEYIGLNNRGKIVKGIIDAEGIDSARERLKKNGIFLNEITELKSHVKRKTISIKLTKKSFNVGYVTRSLSFLLGTSIPIINALEIIIEQLEDEKTKRILVDLKEKIKQGESVSKAFSAYPKIFSNIYISTIRAGELSGKLGEVFYRLAQMYERNEALKNKIKASLTYPIVMFVFAILVVVFLVSFIVPTFEKIFSEFGQRLPYPTRVLIGFSKTISFGWWLILIFFLFIYLTLKKYYSSKKGKKAFDNFVLKLPLVKSLITDSFKIRFSYTMSILLSNGVDIIESLDNTEGIFKNIVFRNIINRAITTVKRGDKLFQAFSGNAIFDPSLLGMLHAGEVSDRVPDVLNKIAEKTESELEARISTFTSFIEPIVILFIGIFVGFVVLSIMLPIFQMNQIF